MTLFLALFMSFTFSTSALIISPDKLFNSADQTLAKFNQQKLTHNNKNSIVSNKFTHPMPPSNDALPNKLSKINCLMLPNKLISQKEFSKILSHFNDDTFNGDELSKLQHYLQNKLIEKGYVTSRVFFKMKNNQKGYFFIQPGRIDDIFFYGFPHGAILHALPIKKYSILRIQDVQDSLDLLNRLPSQRCKIQIRPSKKGAFSSQLYFVNQSQPAFSGEISYHLNEVKLHPSRLNLKSGNFLFLQDTWILSLQQQNNIHHVSDFTQLEISLPYKGALTTFFTSAYNHKYLFKNLSHRHFQSYTNRDHYKFSQTFSAISSQRMKINLEYNYEIKEEKRYFEGLFLKHQHRYFKRHQLSLFWELQAKSHKFQTKSNVSWAQNHFPSLTTKWLASSHFHIYDQTFEWQLPFQIKRYPCSLSLQTKVYYSVQKHEGLEQFSLNHIHETFNFQELLQGDQGSSASLVFTTFMKHYLSFLLKIHSAKTTHSRFDYLSGKLINFQFKKHFIWKNHQINTTIHRLLYHSRLKNHHFQWESSYSYAF